jgi:hypothetical protein
VSGRMMVVVTCDLVGIHMDVVAALVLHHAMIVVEDARDSEDALHSFRVSTSRFLGKGCRR